MEAFALGLQCPKLGAGSWALIGRHSVSQRALLCSYNPKFAFFLALFSKFHCNSHWAGSSFSAKQAVVHSLLCWKLYQSWYLHLG